MLSTIAAAGLAGCAAPASQPPSAGPVFTLWSPAFRDGDELSQQHAGNVPGNPNCGRGTSPPLAWTNVPAGTKTFAFLVYDQGGRNGLGVVHWVAYNVPATVSAFA